MFAVLQGRQSQSRLQSILNWCRAQIKAGATSEFGCCDETEIERMARDVRMSASELRAVAKRDPSAANLLLRRMAALDLDPNEVVRIEPAAVRDLQSVRCANLISDAGGISQGERR